MNAIKETKARHMTENLIDDSDYTNGERTGEITTMLLIMDQLQAKKIETFQLKPFSFGEMNGILKTVTWIITGRTSKMGRTCSAKQHSI